MSPGLHLHSNIMTIPALLLDVVADAGCHHGGFFCL
jgi:hypothetical protein